MSDPTPPLRPFARGHLRAQTAAEAADFDRRSIEAVGVPEAVLMENAGRSAALVARRLFGSPRGPIVALVGSGNNGGDALVALRSFAAWGYHTRAILVADRPVDDPLLHGWPLEVVDDESLDDSQLRTLLESAALVVDGMLGTGIRGAPRARQTRVIEALNTCRAPVVALDVPSGADASTGAVPGAIVEATLTVSFGAPKAGALLHPARAFVGRHVTVEIGFPPSADGDASAFVVTPAWAASHLPRRETDTHKNRVGRVVVVGGGPGMAGAAILAGRAAFRAGAGLVQIATDSKNRDAVHGALPEAIVVAWDDEDGLREALVSADSVVVGPGLGGGEPARDVLRRVLTTGEAPMVIDADGLNLVAEGSGGTGKSGTGESGTGESGTGESGTDEDETRESGTGPFGDRAVLMTPHPGEMKRLMRGEGGNGADGGSRPELARRAARRFGCVVLFKGAPSVVAAPDGPVAIDSQSTSDLAVAGVGDTLAGVCGALLAQGLGTADAGALGLYLSGRAAILADRGAGLTPSDVTEALPDAAAELAEVEAVSMGGAGLSDLDFPFVLYDADPAR